MKKGYTTFLKAILTLIGAVTLVGLVYFPRTEGRAVNMDIVSIYSDPLIIYSFVASIPFFLALIHAMKLVGYAENNTIFSPAAVQSIKLIKHCAIAICGFLIGFLVYIRTVVQGDDPAGPTMLTAIAFLISSVVIAGATVAHRLIQNAHNIKAENDLTV